MISEIIKIISCNNSGMGSGYKIEAFRDLLKEERQVILFI
jgi:hypothetical protein